MGRTLNQEMGDIHETDIAEWTGGRKQKASGSQWHNQGDTKNGEYLVPYPITSDGKSTMGASISVSRAMWNKLVEQTFGQHPALFLRFYQPGATVRNVDIDLAVIRVGLFAELLENARKWAMIEDEIAFEGDLRAKDVIDLLQAVKGVFPQLAPLYFCPTAEEVEELGSSGFDQCCDRPDLHVPLPQGEGTEKLSQILSDRQRDLAWREMVQLGQEMEQESGGPINVVRPDFRKQIRPLAESFEGVHPVPVHESGCDCCR